MLFFKRFVCALVHAHIGYRLPHYIYSRISESKEAHTGELDCSVLAGLTSMVLMMRPRLFMPDLTEITSAIWSGPAAASSVGVEAASRTSSSESVSSAHTDTPSQQTAQTGVDL